MDMLMKQLEEIQQIENENIEQAFQAYQQLELSLVHAPNAQKAEFYLHYALFMFRIEDYGQCMEFLAQAQEYGFPKEEIRQFVYEAFIEPNLAECKENYHMNMKKLKDNIYVGEDTSFEDLRLWFIPTLTTNKKYFYDQLEEKIICVNADDKKSVEFPEPVNIFGDYLLAVDNIYEMISYIRKSPEQKKLYIYAGQIKYFLSFFQMSDLNRFLIFIQKVKVFVGRQSIINYFMEHNAYLPRNFISASSDFSVEDIVSLVDEIHNKRIHDLTRKRDNILLTIGIPSCNRGHRAYESVVHYLQLEYDDEIEIVISKNFTDNNTLCFYEQIEEIKDARLRYCSLPELMYLPFNMDNVFRHSKGKFVCFLSDEDVLFLNKMDIILETIVQNENISMIKIYGDGQQEIQNTGLALQGVEAIDKYGFSANYLSGNIFNLKILQKSKGLEYVVKNTSKSPEDIDKNLALRYYSHIFLELVMCVEGDVIGINDILFHEGISENIENSSTQCLPVFAYKESRIEQHHAFLDIFLDFPLFYKNPAILSSLYKSLCKKTFHLICFVTIVDIYYKRKGFNGEEIIKEVYNECLKGLNRIYPDKNDKKYQEDLFFLNYLSNFCIDKKMKL